MYIRLRLRMTRARLTYANEELVDVAIAKVPRLVAARDAPPVRLDGHQQATIDGLVRAQRSTILNRTNVRAETGWALVEAMGFTPRDGAQKNPAAAAIEHVRGLPKDTRRQLIAFLNYQTHRLKVLRKTFARAPPGLIMSTVALGKAWVDTVSEDPSRLSFIADNCDLLREEDLFALVE